MIGLFICATIFGITMAIYDKTQKMELTIITIDTSWVRKNIKNVAIKKTEQEYKAAGYVIKKRQNTYPPGYKDRLNKYEANLLSALFENGKLKPDFNNITKTHHRELRKRNFSSYIYEYFCYEAIKIKNPLDEYLVNKRFITTEAFMGLKSSAHYEFPGVYVLYNQNKQMYYVGQSIKTIDRVNQHLSGRGNGDVYADYKYGDIFWIQLLPLEGSGFADLNSEEKYFIQKYNAYTHGYNKTSGNGY